MLQREIMLAHRLRHALLAGLGQIEELRNISHAYTLGAGRAVATVHAVSVPAYPREGCQSRGIIALLLACFFIIKALLKLFGRARAGHDRGDAGAGQGIMDALVDRKGSSGR